MEGGRNFYSMIFTKYLTAIAVALAFGAGLFLGLRVQPKPPEIKIPACPACPSLNCPPAVSLQNFDLEKLNNKRGNFTYSPNLHDVRVVIESKDSVFLKQLIQAGACK